MAETPITIDQAWADGWPARVKAARAEVARRLEVCEAQTKGEWSADAVTDERGRGLISSFDGPDHILIAENVARADSHAIAAQRTERPQELRTLAALLDMLDGVALGPRSFAQRSVAERGLRIVEEGLWKS